MRSWVRAGAGAERIRLRKGRGEGVASGSREVD